MGDQTDKILATTINQLSDSANYLDLLRWLGESFDNIDEMLEYVATINVYEAKGVWLDLIGVIVGQSREIPFALLLEYFGYRTQPAATGYSQARYRKDGDPTSATSILPDDEYRNVILARVARNYGDITAIGVVTGVQNIVNTDEVFVEQGDTGGNFKLFINANISSSIKTLISDFDIVPRGAGIGVKYIASGTSGKTFGYRNQTPTFYGYGIGSYAKRFV